MQGLISVAAPYEVWAFGFSVIGIADSSPAGVMNIFVLGVVCGQFRLITRREESYRMWRVWV
jgi:hypothetical protein